MSRILLLTLIVTNCGVLLRLILLVLLLLFSADRIQNAADSTLGLSVRRLAGSAALIFLTENGAQNSGGQLGWILCIGQHVFKFHLRNLLNVGRNMRDAKWVWGKVYVDRLSRDAAVLTATWSIPHIAPDDRPHVIQGAWTAVFRRIQGKWMIVVEHLSVPPS